MFDLVDGLPIHVLIVHAVVVFLPLIAAGFITVIFVPKFRHNIILGLLLAGLFIGMVSAFIAEQSGQEFATHVGLPVRHAELGDWVPWLSFAWLIIASLWVYVYKKNYSKVAQLALAAATVGLSVLVAVLVALTGHSGVQASWASKMAPVTAAPLPAAAPSVNAASSGTPSASSSTPTGSVSSSGAGSSSSAPSSSVPAVVGYASADVSSHATPSDCWTVVSGNVYDVTAWIPLHPGGPAVIEGMCGGDGTAMFTSVHANSATAKTTLETYKIGVFTP